MPWLETLWATRLWPYNHFHARRNQTRLWHWEDAKTMIETRNSIPGWWFYPWPEGSSSSQGSTSEQSRLEWPPKCQLHPHEANSFWWKPSFLLAADFLFQKSISLSNSARTQREGCEVAGTGWGFQWPHVIQVGCVPWVLFLASERMTPSDLWESVKSICLALAGSGALWIFQIFFFF